MDLRTTIHKEIFSEMSKDELRKIYDGLTILTTRISFSDEYERDRKLISDELLKRIGRELCNKPQKNANTAECLSA